MKNLFGKLIQHRREAMGMTQRGLAREVGVKPSHIGYLEHGHRRPSLALVGRLAETLGLDKQMLFLMAHPEARQLVETQSDNGDKPVRAWEEFIKDKALVARYNIKPAEIKVLSQVNMLGKIEHTRDFLYVLQAIRQALREDWSRKRS